MEIPEGTIMVSVMDDGGSNALPYAGNQGQLCLSGPVQIDEVNRLKAFKLRLRGDESRPAAKGNRQKRQRCQESEAEPFSLDRGPAFRFRLRIWRYC